MDRNDPLYSACINVLRNHLKPAMGCTEPVAIAYATALCRDELGVEPETILAEVSGSVLKNARAVIVPNTRGRKGIDAAVAAGLAAGVAEKELQVISEVSDAQIEAIDALLASGRITTQLMPDARVFDIRITCFGGGHIASVRVADRHTNVAEVCRDGSPVRGTGCGGEDAAADTDEALLTIDGIYDFAVTCRTEDVAELLDRQIEYNTAIAEEGLTGRWGAAIGAVLLASSGGGPDVRLRARAWAAAGSDARMSGCELPVIINSGSGNQGLTVSLPVIIYARGLGASHDQTLRALALGNLTAVRLKAMIGTLSAYCGAVSAGCAAGAGVSFLHGGSLRQIEHVIVNSLAILSGTICDGAKPSCAAKIACAVDAGLMGWEMARAGREFRGGEGIVTRGVERTIANVGRLGREGMRGTDAEILSMMLAGGDRQDTGGTGGEEHG